MKIKNIILAFLLLCCTGSYLYSKLSYKHTIIDYLRDPGSFGQLYSLLQASNLDIRLYKTLEKNFTLFAPTDRAFAEFGRVGLLRGEKNKKKLITFMKYHILKRRRSVKQIKRRGSFKTLAKEPLDKEELGEILYSVKVENGIVHVIDRVLVPPSLKKDSTLYPK